jgi:bifunctional N-acetylglutamate synthase/kinase
VESGFGRRLAVDYFDKIRLHQAFVSEHYRAALLLTLENGLPHLDKFAVSDDAQGEGLGRAAWQVMREATPRLFWRSRSNNPINEFYFAEADGCFKGEQWNVFWYGLESFEDIQFAVDHCRARPPSLKD